MSKPTITLLRLLTSRAAVALSLATVVAFGSAGCAADESDDADADDGRSGEASSAIITNKCAGNAHGQTAVLGRMSDPDRTLPSGSGFDSCNGQWRLKMVGGSGLSLYERTTNGWSLRWRRGSGGTRAEMQADGNLVVYNRSGGAPWASGTTGSHLSLELTDYGGLALIRTNADWVKFLR